MTKSQFIAEAQRSGVKLAAWCALGAGVKLAQVQLWALTVRGAA